MIIERSIHRFVISVNVTRCCCTLHKWCIDIVIARCHFNWSTNWNLPAPMERQECPCLRWSRLRNSSACEVTTAGVKIRRADRINKITPWNFMLSHAAAATHQKQDPPTPRASPPFAYTGIYIHGRRREANGKIPNGKTVAYPVCE